MRSSFLAGVLAGACVSLGASASAQSSNGTPTGPNALPVNAPFGLPRMVSPAIDDPAKPFSYPSRPTDQIGVMGAPFGTEITPEGYLYSGYGELMFFLGLDREPLNQRHRTLEAGHLPVVLYDQEHGGLEYRFTVFAADVSAAQNGSNVVNFVRITVHNAGTTMRRGYLTSAWRYSGDQSTAFPAPDDRFRRPVAAKTYGGYVQQGDTFRPDSQYTSTDHTFLRDGKAIYFFPESFTKDALNKAFRGYYGRVTHVTAGPVEDGKPIAVLPTTPMAVAEFSVDVPAGEDRVLDFRMPLAPVDPKDPAFAAVQHADFEQQHAKTVRAWNELLARGMQIVTPEDKVNQVFQASLVNDLLALNHVGSDWIQTINQLHYHGFYLRDSSDFVRMYDTTGYPELGRNVVNFFASRQQPDGNFLSQPGQFDGWGYTLLTYGEHYRMTHDKAFAAEVYPRVVRAVDWLQKATAADPFHLVPATNIHDNEYIPGHLTGYNFLALDGLKAAKLLAHDLGHAEDEARFRDVETKLHTALLHRLDEITSKTDGYIPPALDSDNGGADWGNLLSITPEQVLSPSDPRVAKTLQTTRARYEEGLITYREPGQGSYLHHYLGIKNTLTELVLDDQELAIEDLYAMLLHTTSTQGGFEFSIRPWGDRDFNGNLTPHGWFAAEYRNMLRNMMVREEGDTLHLLSAISPAWAGAGKRIVVQGAVTYFGHIGFVLAFPSDHEAALTLEPSFDAEHEPKTMELHLPWFMDVSSVTVDGSSITPVHGAVMLPLNAKQVRWQWKMRTLPASLPADFSDAVQRYKAEYARRYQQLIEPAR